MNKRINKSSLNIVIQRYFRHEKLNSDEINLLGIYLSSYYKEFETDNVPSIMQGPYDDIQKINEMINFCLKNSLDPF